MKITVNNQVFDIEFEHSVVPIEFFKQIKEPTGQRRQVKVPGEAEQTRCLIKTEKGGQLEGVARRYKNDKSNRVIARTVAFNRAISGLDSKTQTAILNAVPFRLA